MSTQTTPNPIDEALDTVEEIREDLERVASSDLPFADHAQDILDDADRRKREET